MVARAGGRRRRGHPEAVSNAAAAGSHEARRATPPRPGGRGRFEMAHRLRRPASIWPAAAAEGRRLIGDERDAGHLAVHATAAGPAVRGQPSTRRCRARPVPRGVRDHHRRRAGRTSSHHFKMAAKPTTHCEPSSEVPHTRGGACAGRSPGARREARIKATSCMVSHARIRKEGAGGQAQGEALADVSRLGDRVLSYGADAGALLAKGKRVPAALMDRRPQAAAPQQDGEGEGPRSRDARRRAALLIENRGRQRLGALWCGEEASSLVSCIIIAGGDDGGAPTILAEWSPRARASPPTTRPPSSTAQLVSTTSLCARAPSSGGDRRPDPGPGPGPGPALLDLAAGPGGSPWRLAKRHCPSRTTRSDARRRATGALAFATVSLNRIAARVGAAAASRSSHKVEARSSSPPPQSAQTRRSPSG